MSQTLPPQSTSSLPEGEIFVNLPAGPIKNRPRLSLTTLRTLFLALSLVVIGWGLGYQYHAIKTTGLDGKKPVKLQRSELDFTQFWEVWDKLETDYVDSNKIDSQKMIQGAISGMTQALGDPYTVYLPPSENQQSKEDLNGEFEGVGIQLGYKQGTLAVQTPLENHPAIKVGVKAGDLILHIVDTTRNTDTDTAGMTLTDAVKLIRGPKGTQVTLTLFRESKGKFDVSITRDKIVMPSVELVWGEVNNQEFVKSTTPTATAWLRVYRFGDNTMPQWDEAVNSILRNRDTVKQVVLDLRNNPGGYLNDAVDIASDFIPDGVIVTQQEKHSSKNHTVSRKARLLDMPISVIVNGGSASASEILAGALRDRIKAKLVGEKSFGKGTVQEVQDLRGGAGVHITVAKWLLPSGEWIHDKGILPEFEVKITDTATDSATTPDIQLLKAIEVLK